jgi:HD-GYP domain-containing protein (c-di-GMP phosphodiesterase class II)
MQNLKKNIFLGSLIVSFSIATILNFLQINPTFIFFLYIGGLFSLLFLKLPFLLVSCIGLILYLGSSLLVGKLANSLFGVILFSVSILGGGYLRKVMVRNEQEIKEIREKYEDTQEELERTRKLMGDYIMKELSYSDILVHNLQEAYYYTLRGLVSVFENRDPYTRGHSDRVTEYAVKIAYKMKLPPRLIRLIRYATQLHDVGRISIPLSILNKVDALNDEEFEFIKSHAIRSELMASPLEFLHEGLTFVRHHHERVNGTGYPDRLKQDEIPLGARIIAVADAFDAMTSSRTYRRPLSVEEALEELKNNAGKQHDPYIVEVFFHVIEDMRKTSELSKPLFQPSLVI